MSTTKQVRAQKFPRNNRFFTELAALDMVVAGKILLFSLVTTVLLVLILLRAYDLFEAEKVLQAASLQRQELEGQRLYWLKVIKDHPGYRDAYFKVAVLDIQLGNKKEAKQYVESTLS